MACGTPITRDSIRLEIVRLCHRHDLEPERIIERAKAIEAYVLEPAAGAPQASKRREPAGNSEEVI